MFREPTIVMDLEQLLKKRLHLVVDLQKRPDGFRGHWQWLDPMPEKDCPKSPPPNVEFLSSVEWSWSPMNSRWEAYYLNPTDKYWLLWIRYPDDTDRDIVWRWDLYAWGLRNGVSEKEAAVYLLADAWSAEARDSDLDRFHLINDAGLLSLPELYAVGRLVWPYIAYDEDEEAFNEMWEKC